MQKERTSTVSRLGSIHILFTTNYAFIPGTFGSFHVYERPATLCAALSLWITAPHHSTVTCLHVMDVYYNMFAHFPMSKHNIVAVIKMDKNIYK
jgi:hypothetical protein